MPVAELDGCADTNESHRYLSSIRFHLDPGHPEGALPLQTKVDELHIPQPEQARQQQVGDLGVNVIFFKKNFETKIERLFLIMLLFMRKIYINFGLRLKKSNSLP
jgi:hypothetical protein